MGLSELMRAAGVEDAATRGHGDASGSADPEILRVCEDSRRVRAGDFFVARSGTKTSGAVFAKDAIAKGAAAVVSEEPVEVPRGIAFVRVADANKACALLAHAVAGFPTRGMTMIGVTGTKGKTTVAM